MSLRTLEIGHPKSRTKITNKTLITVQGLKYYAHSLEDAAKVQLFITALEGKGPIAKILKDEAKKLAEKFEKANPDFEFAVVGRPVGSKNKSKEMEKKPSKSDKKSAKTDKEMKKSPKKKAMKETLELATA